MPVTLELARQRVLRARQIVEDQRARIARLKRDSGRAKMSNALLQSFEDTLRIFEADLERLERQASPHPAAGS